jgi:hypothetical protein
VEAEMLTKTFENLQGEEEEEYITRADSGKLAA